jgi:hypothetical protein
VPVELAWWQSAADVVAAVGARYGFEVTILRLLHAERATPPGGAVTYLAQVPAVPAVGLTPARVRLSDHPRRAAYARPGGPQASLHWATAAVDQIGRGPVAGAAQQRTWNLSSIWRLHTPTGPVWLKEVPDFFAHEAAVLRWLTGRGYADAVPRLLAGDGGRMVLDHVPGEDLYGAGLDVRDAIGAQMHRIQVDASSSSEVDRLLHMGLPDRRLSSLAPLLTRVATSAGGAAPGLDGLLAELPARLARVQECGLPDTLVHGDLHPGNVRGDGSGRTVIIDWGDSVVGHPAFDILRLTEDLPPTGAEVLLDAWARRWQAAVPGSDPRRAVELMRPVTALIYAAVYAGFLDAIEPSEHPYHRDDVPAYLRQAVTAWGAGAEHRPHTTGPR